MGRTELRDSPPVSQAPPGAIRLVLIRCVTPVAAPNVGSSFGSGSRTGQGGGSRPGKPGPWSLIWRGRTRIWRGLGSNMVEPIPGFEGPSRAVWSVWAQPFFLCSQGRFASAGCRMVVSEDEGSCRCPNPRNNTSRCGFRVALRIRTRNKTRVLVRVVGFGAQAPPDCERQG